MLIWRGSIDCHGQHEIDALVYFYPEEQPCRWHGGGYAKRNIEPGVYKTSVGDIEIKRVDKKYVEFVGRGHPAGLLEEFQAGAGERKKDKKQLIRR